VAARAGYDVPALPESIVSTVQAAAASLVVGLGLALVLPARRLALAARATRFRIALRRAAPAHTIRSLAFAPRPPPVVSRLS
jgi:hypothetical protein